MKRQLSTLLHLFVLLALSACVMTTPRPVAIIQPSRWPNPGEVKAFLAQLVDVEKRVPGIVVGMIAADPSRLTAGKGIR